MLHIVWFKRDLRLTDHPPLFNATLSGAVLPLYIVEPELWKQPDMSSRHWHFIHDSLCDLDSGLQNYGAKLVIRIGEAITVLENLRNEYKNITLWSHQETGNLWTFKRDINVAKWCKENGIAWHEFPANGIVRALQTRDQWSKIRNDRMMAEIIPAPLSIKIMPDLLSENIPAKDSLLFLHNRIPGTTQAGGRKEAQKTLHSFLHGRCRNYMKTISKPGISARHCSRLSAHIAYGTLSVREIEQATKARIKDLQAEPYSEHLCYQLRAFLSRLAWRCHFIQKLEQQPSIETTCMHPAFEGMREPHFREDYLHAWKTGNTGYPLVDACMRSLIANGWITFRMRAMLVSFASYHLWLDWRKTAPYMAGLFTDYEPGIHYSQFQMQSGVTGINTIRIYNPIKQSIEHDPDGKFILRYVPELQNLSITELHEPWKTDVASLQYPPPIVDQKSAVQYAKDQIAERRKSAGFREKSLATYQKLGSRQSPNKKKVVNKTKIKQMALEMYS